MTVYRDVHNKRFDAALEFVMLYYQSLFHPKLTRILFLRAWVIKTLSGQYIHYHYNETGHIWILNGRYTVAEFVDTLVHELTHFHQFLSGRNELLVDEEQEEEATKAGLLAQKDYFRRTACKTRRGRV